MNKKYIFIIGGGGHAKVIISIIKKIPEFELLGYVDNNNYGDILGCKYIGNDEKFLTEKVKNKNYLAVLGVGAITINKKREEIFNKYKKIGFNFPPIISPSSIINEDVEINEGTVIFDKVVINSGSKIGACSIINTASVVEHDCVIGDFAHICPGSIVSGGVKIGKHTFVGAGSVLKQYIEVTDECIIGSGSTVINDIKESGVYVGSPARKIK